MLQPKKTLLWQIKGEQLQSPCYLFGTMHVRDERAFSNIEYIEECVEACEAFAAEYDLSEQDMEMFQEVAMLPDEQRISDVLSPPLYKKLVEVFQRETGQDLRLFERQKPVMIANFVMAAQFSEDRQEALDMHLYSFAQKAGKTMLGLETYSSQLKVMQAMPMREQIKSLKEISTNFKSFRKDLKQTTEAYLESDLHKILQQVKTTAGGMRKIMIYDRNIVMADRIMELGSKHSLFAAVGAGHLGGRNGLIRLLKARGCTVRPIYYREDRLFTKSV